MNQNSFVNSQEQFIRRLATGELLRFPTLPRLVYLPVERQRVQPGKVLPAYIADKLLLSGVERHVHLQIPPRHVPSIADLTDERPIVAVNPLMHLQVAFASKRLLTLRARESNARVGRLFVLLQQIAIGELLSTLAALERLQTQVPIFVIQESFLAFERSLLADVAAKCFLLRVRSQVAG